MKSERLIALFPAVTTAVAVVDLAGGSLDFTVTGVLCKYPSWTIP